MCTAYMYGIGICTHNARSLFVWAGMGKWSQLKKLCRTHYTIHDHRTQSMKYSSYIMLQVHIAFNATKLNFPIHWCTIYEKLSIEN